MSTDSNILGGRNDKVVSTLKYQEVIKYRWHGSDEPYIDIPTTKLIRDIVVGHFGGSSIAGANKNEDAVLQWGDQEGQWEFTVLLDAHNTDASARIVLDEVENESTKLIGIFSDDSQLPFTSLYNYLISIFCGHEFRSKCKDISGETSCLICFRKENYLWWMNIGDCALYLFHPELAQFGQYALNQRNFFEWIGFVNTFENKVPCFSTGIRELRKGNNQILLTTDGLLEFGERPFENAKTLYELCKKENSEAVDLKQCVDVLLGKVQEGFGRDSTTVVSWNINSRYSCAYPSDE